MKGRNYLSFTPIELSNNLLFGQVAFIAGKKDDSIVFEAELLKFFIDLHEELVKAKSKWVVLSPFTACIKAICLIF